MRKDDQNMITFSYSYGQLSNPGHIPYPIYFSLLGLLYLSDCLSIHVRQFLISFHTEQPVMCCVPVILRHIFLKLPFSKPSLNMTRVLPKANLASQLFTLGGGISPVLASAADMSALRMKC